MPRHTGADSANARSAVCRNAVRPPVRTCAAIRVVTADGLREAVRMNG